MANNQFEIISNENSAAINSGRIALGLSYHGANYRGWQTQLKPAVPTVQSTLEKALSCIAAQPVTVFCAGRTDSGVHGTNQVVHFDCPVDRPLKAWVRGANTQLPDDIAVHWVKAVSEDFHARFSATARRYRYIINNCPTRSAVLASGVTHIRKFLDHQAMHSAAQALLGEQDFSSFRAAGCESSTPMRNIHHIDVSRKGDIVVIDIQANAFLYHMVRNITGALLAVGNGTQTIGWLKELLSNKDRCLAPATAPAEGLYLVDVIYPDEFGLPKPPIGPFFLG